MPREDDALTDMPGNRLLGCLAGPPLRRLLDAAEPVSLSLRSVLMEQGKPIRHLWFPQSGSVSLINTLADGSRIEVGLIGSEGLVGLPVLLGTDIAPVEAMVQIEGAALRLPVRRFRELVADLDDWKATLLRYADASLSQLMQVVACTNRHDIAQRLCRWILMSHDRAGSDTFPMTQEFMATMLGVRRPGVTLAIGRLQQENLVVHDRGVVHVRSRAGLEARTCECYAIMCRHDAAVLEPMRSTISQE